MCRSLYMFIDMWDYHNINVESGEKHQLTIHQEWMIYKPIRGDIIGYQLRNQQV